MTATSLTANLSTGFFRAVARWVSEARQRGATLTGHDVLAVLENESGLRSDIQNRLGAPAYGLNQLMAPERPQGSGFYPGLQSVGFTGTPHDYLALSPEDQFPFVARFWNSVSGKYAPNLVNGGSLYLLNFLPAYIAYATDPSHVLATRNPAGPDVTSPESDWQAWRASHGGDWYAWNRGFDFDRKGTIVVGDMAKAVARVQQGPKWQELVARYDSESGDGPGGGGGIADTWSGAAAIATIAGALGLGYVALRSLAGKRRYAHA